MTSTGAEALLAKKATSPLYNAVMLCVLTPERTALKLAMPLTNGAVPTTVAPSRKVTLPVGAPGSAGPGATVALMPISALAAACRVLDYAESGGVAFLPTPFGASFRTPLTK